MTFWKVKHCKWEGGFDGRRPKSSNKHKQQHNRGSSNPQQEHKQQEKQQQTAQTTQKLSGGGGSHGGSPKAGVPKPKPGKSGAPKGGDPEGWGPKPRKSGPPKGGALKGGGPEGWEAQNFVLFFPRPPLFSFFLPLLGVVSWNFGGVIEGRDPQMCTFGVLGLSCEAPAAEKFLFCTDTTESIGWPSPAPRLHIDDCFEIHNLQGELCDLL